MFGRKTKKENQILTDRVAELENVIARMGGGDALRVQNEIQNLTEHLQQLDAQKRALFAEVEVLDQRKRSLQGRIVDMEEQEILQGFNWYDYKNPAEESVRLAEQLERTRREAKAMVTAKTAVTATSNFVFNNSKSKGKSFVNRLSKLALRSYNAEVENAITRLKAGNLEAGIKRINRAREQVEKMGSMINLRIAGPYHSLRLDELRLTAKHLDSKKLAKEAEREERARLREEKKVQQELEAERKRLQKEKTHYENVLLKLRREGRDDEAAELAHKLAEIEKGIENVDYRQANIRAGYVYVISNVGSFGEKMVKIGMTRRLDPMDRVRELSDASVPFNFDVHALHFSEDAVGIEAELHRRFARAKVNRINNRREFFYATPAEVREALLQVDGNVLEYTEEPEAEQFRQSEAIRDQESH